MKTNTLCKKCLTKGWLNLDTNKVIINSLRYKCEKCGEQIE